MFADEMDPVFHVVLVGGGHNDFPFVISELNGICSPPRRFGSPQTSQNFHLENRV